MSEAMGHTPEPTPGFPPQRDQPFLQVVESSTELFPLPTEHLPEEVLRTYDKQALSIIGSLGLREAFDTLDDWLRFKYRSTERLAESIAIAPDSPFVKSQQAARYIVGQRLMKVVPKAPDAAAEEKNLQLFRRFKLFQDLRHEALRQPEEHLAAKRVELAKISIISVLTSEQEQKKSAQNET